MSVVEAGISAIIIIGAAASLAGAVYGMSTLPRTDSLSIANLDYDFPMVIRYNATVSTCFAGSDLSCEARVLQYFQEHYGLKYVSYERQVDYAYAGNLSKCVRAASAGTYCFAAPDGTLSCIYACGG